MGKRVLKVLRDDLWVILLDIIAVNAAYYLALLIRFFVGGKFLTSLRELPYAYSKFAPFYTVICIIVFFLFRLYGGMWRYAGVRDINRIIGASIVTTIIQIVGTLLFVQRMPLTFYFIGAALQFIFIILIRFSYRFVIVERKKFGGKKANAIVIGANDQGRYVIGMLDNGPNYRPACIIDDEYDGKNMDGIPVHRMDEIEEVIGKYSIGCIAIANTDAERREKISAICKYKGITLRDYSAFFNYDGEVEDGTVIEATTGSGQKMIPFSPPDISDLEIDEVVETLKSGWITTGPRTKLLERRLAAYIETGKTDIDTEAEVDRWKERVVCLNSATSAEELNLRILGIQEGDEVIVPAYTYTASASAPIHCGATVKFVDIQKDGAKDTHMPEMDYDALEAAITEKTKAIIVVDLGGIVADYDRIIQIVDQKKDVFTPMESDGTPLRELSSRIQKAIGRVAIVSDDAHSLGGSRVVRGQRKNCGAISDFTSFSFHAVKNFTTAEGGASTWRPIPGVSNAEIYKFYQLLSLHGQSKDALAKTKVGAWEYDVIGPWYKCNMTDIMASIGLHQLDRYPGLLKRREQIIRKYDGVCDELGLNHLYHHTDNMDSSNHLYLVRIPGADHDQRNKVIEEMAKNGVSTNVHYKPLPMMTAYKEAGIENFPNAYDYYQNLFTLPLHTLLSDGDVDFVCETLQKVVRKMRT